MSTESKTTPARKALVYHGTGRTMEPEPINMRLDAAGVAERALQSAFGGESIVVRLEPGDMTRYDLLVVPLWAALVDANALGFASLKRETALVVNMRDAMHSRGTVVRRGGYYGALLESGAWGSEWSRVLLEWWFEQHLWPRIVSLRGESAPV